MPKVSIKTTVTYSKSEVLEQFGFKSLGDMVDVSIADVVSITIENTVTDDKLATALVSDITNQYSK